MKEHKCKELASIIEEKQGCEFIGLNKKNKTWILVFGVDLPSSNIERPETVMLGAKVKYCCWCGDELG